MPPSRLVPQLSPFFDALIAQTSGNAAFDDEALRAAKDQALVGDVGARALNKLRHPDFHCGHRLLPSSTTRLPKAGRE